MYIRELSVCFAVFLSRCIFLSCRVCLRTNEHVHLTALIYWHIA